MSIFCFKFWLGRFFDFWVEVALAGEKMAFLE
jgi:hypothetical protein